MTVNGNLISEYSEFVSEAVEAFLPLTTTIIGVFLAFAIANQLRFFIMKMK